MNFHCTMKRFLEKKGHQLTSSRDSGELAPKLSSKSSDSSILKEAFILYIQSKKVNSPFKTNFIQLNHKEQWFNVIYTLHTTEKQLYLDMNCQLQLGPIYIVKVLINFFENLK